MATKEEKKDIEMVVCASVKVKNNRMSSYQKEEYIFNGVNHWDILHSDEFLYLQTKCRFYEYENGFFTTYGRFVNDIEAQQVAIKSGQYIDPHAKIKSLKELIKDYYLSMRETRSQLAHSSFMKSKNEAQKELEELEAGYLGREFRIEDLHYVKP